MTASGTVNSIWDARLRNATLALITTIALAAFEGLAVAAAIPDITADLGQVALTSWILTGYFVASTVATLAAGPVVDQRGVRWTFDVALTLFIGASVVCAVAPTMPLLIAGRVAQGLGGGALISVALATVGLIYPERLRARQYAAQSAVWGSMSVLGPAAAALFISTTGWPGVFWINVPLGGLALVLGHRALPAGERTEAGNRTDVAGLALATAFILALITALSTLSIRTVAFALLTLALGTLWWVQSGRVARPMVNRSHVATNPYRLIGLTIGLGMAAAVALNLYLPIVVRGALGMSEGAAAFSLLFFSLSWTVGAQITSRLLDHHPAPTVAIAGFLLLLIGAGAGALLGATPSYAGLATTASIRGLGIGMASIPYLTELQRHAAVAEFGRINAAHQFFRFIGLNISIALVGTIIFFVVDRRTGDVEAVRDLLAGEDLAVGAELRDSLGSGYQWAQAAMTAIAVVALVLAVRTRRWLLAADTVGR